MTEESKIQEGMQEENKEESSVTPAETTAAAPTASGECGLAVETPPALETAEAKETLTGEGGEGGGGQSETDGAEDSPSPVDETALVQEVTRLREVLAEAKQAQQELKERLLRMQADFENFRRRTRLQMEEMTQAANRELLKKLLPLVDNLERALAAAGTAPAEGGTTAPAEGEGLRTGVELIYRQFQELLAREGVEVIPTVGEPFDPHYHEAIMRGPSEDFASNTVCEEFQKGYRVGKDVLRPAMVKVAE